ncbi:MAG: ribonuclease J [Candidatus Paceibacterota bacterium]
MDTSPQPNSSAPKKPFSHSHNRDGHRQHQQARTRILRNDTRPPVAGGAIAGNRPANPAPAPYQGHHRIVLGRGARKVAGVGHIAGARMSIVRKAGKMGRKGPSKPPGPNRAGDIIPPLSDGAIRIVPLGGVEEVGRNMTAIEYKNEIIIVDMGFQFKEEGTPGIDYILPNTKYLEERREKIKGVFITHGHLDHIGGIPYIMPRIGNPPMYSRQFGAIMIMKRQTEFPHVPPINMKVLDKNETITISPHWKVETFAISHTIPDAMGLIIHTGVGDIVFIEDVRVDNVKGVPTEEEERQYARFKGKKALLLTMDSTSIEKHGFSLSESTVTENIEKLIRAAGGRIIIGTFASQVERIINIIKIAERYNKKIAIEGRSMKTNIEIIKTLKLAEITNIIPIEEIENHAPDRIIMLVTGAQGEEFAALGRIANKTHKFIKLRPTDTIILSSSIIPTNHNAVIKLKDNLYRSDAKVITYLDSDIHASGHGNRDELKWIHEHVDYKFFMPVHGHHYMLRQHAELALSLGAPRENVVIPDNGSIIEIDPTGDKITVRKEKAPSGLVLVDGFSVGDVQDVVIRDRQMLAQDGIFIIFGIINATTGKLKKSPDIISRGFVYLRESQELLHGVRLLIKDTIEGSTRGMNPINLDLVKDNVTDAVSKFLLQETAKRPMVIPVILTI